MRKLAVVGLVMVGLVVAHVVADFPSNSPLRIDGNLSDAGFDWLTAQTVFSGGSPYDTLNELARQYLSVDIGPDLPHPRGPGALLLQVPMGKLLPGWVLSVMQLALVGAIIYLAWAAVRLADVGWWWMLAIGVGLFLIPPTIKALRVGSQGPIVAALVGATWLATRNSDKPSGGVALGVASTLKLFPGLLIPMLWMSGRRRVAAGAAATLVGLNLAGLALPGVTLAGTVDTLLLQSTIYRSYTLALPMAVVAVAALGLVAAARWLTVDQAMVVGIVGMLVLSPIVWSHYLVVLVLPLAHQVAAVARPADAVEPDDSAFHPVTM